jgi:hypothetical protein
VRLRSGRSSNFGTLRRLRRWIENQLEARMLRQSGAHELALVRGHVVADQMDSSDVHGVLAIDRFEQLDAR